MYLKKLLKKLLSLKLISPDYQLPPPPPPNPPPENPPENPLPPLHDPPEPEDLGAAVKVVCIELERLFSRPNKYPVLKLFK